ncbi:MAG TPA: hypothetical protein VMK84_28580 [Streptosporangiaceae bacterium]|nr:hypothetical protein [Streptosporangiaceae bacterium]
MTDFCWAMTGAGTPVTVYGPAGPALAIMRRDSEPMICTQDPGHDRGHSACDGAGHILARWPRASVERYWQPGDCGGHGHG